MTILYYYEHSCLCSVFPAISLRNLVVVRCSSHSIPPSIHPSIYIFFLHPSERANQLDTQTLATNPPLPPLSPLLTVIISLPPKTASRSSNEIHQTRATPHYITLHLHPLRIFRLFFSLSRRIGSRSVCFFVKLFLEIILFVVGGGGEVEVEVGWGW